LVEAQALRLAAVKTIRRHVKEMTGIVMTGAKMKVAGMNTIDASIVMTGVIAETADTVEIAEIAEIAVMSVVDVMSNEREI
jgi:hypothetical protein